MIRQVVPTLVTLALMGALLVAYRHQSEQEKPDPDLGETLVAQDRANLDVIEITNGHGSAVLEKQGGSWKLTRPVADELDPDRLEALLVALSLLQAARRVELEGGNADLAAYGLDKPLASVSWKGTAGGRLDVGLLSPLDDSRYVKLEGNPGLWMVPTGALAPVLDDPRTYRDTRILVFDPAAVTKVEIAGNGDPLILVRESGSEPASWRIEAPAALVADEMQVANSLSAWAAMRAETFVDDAPASLPAYGLEPPAGRLTLHLGDGKSLSLRIGGTTKEEGSVHVKREDRPFVLAVGRASLSDLALGVAGWRDKRVAAADPATVTRVTVEAEGRSVSASRQTTHWRFESPLFLGDATRMAPVLVETLAGLHARRFLPDTGSVTASAWATITVEGGPAPVAVTLHEGPAGEPVSRVTPPGLAFVPMQDVGQVARKFLGSYRRMATLDRGVVTEITLKRGPQERVLRRVPGTPWRLDGHGDRSFDETAAALIDAVEGLEAEEAIDPGADRDAHGLGDGADRFTFGGNLAPPVTVLLGRSEEGRRAIEITGTNRLGWVRSPALDAAMRELETPLTPSSPAPEPR